MWTVLSVQVQVGPREMHMDPKYFQHAGCLMTADGTDDDLIKLEGAPAGYKVVVPS